MADQSKIKAKEAQLLKHLEDWVRDSGALGPGEQLVFSLDVRSNPAVLVKGVTEFSAQTEAYLDLPLDEAFSHEKLEEAGCDPKLFRKKIWTAWNYITRSPNQHTLREMLADSRVPGMLRQVPGLHWRNTGTKTLEVMKKVLKHNGVKF